MSIDLNGREFKIAANQDPPYFVFEEYNGGLRVKEGLEVEILKGMSQKYNFTFKLIDCGLSWGSLLPNNSWTGIVGKLVKKEADMGLGEISITGERAKYIDFSYPHSISTVTYITSPPISDSKFSSMFNYFDLVVWISLTSTLFSITWLILLLSKYNICGKFYDLIWIALELLMKQSSKFKGYKRTSIFDIFLVFWLIFCTIFSTIYGNCIYSQIVFPLKHKSIDTIEKLYEAKVRGEVAISILEYTSKYDLMRQSDLLMYRTISESITFYKNDPTGISAVIHNDNHPRAHILSREYLNYASYKFEQGAFYTPPYNDETTFFLDLLAIAYTNKFQYKQAFDETIFAMKEAGLFHYWMLVANAKTKANSRLSKNKTEQAKFDLHHFDIYFYLLLFGLLVSSSVFVFEYKLGLTMVNNLSRRRLSYYSITYSIMVKFERRRISNSVNSLVIKN